MRRPWMPLYVGDYLADTAHLRATEHGAYLLLIMHYWRSEGLPKDDDSLARIARITLREWMKMRPIIAALFCDDWKHKRIEFELTEAARISAAGKKGGKASGEARRKKSFNEKQTISERPFNDIGSDLRTNREALQSQSKSSEASASDAEASIDHRKRLFNEGLAKLSFLTGKGPDACRSFVGKCLKAAGDDAVVVMGLIEDAERNQVVDPSAWIAARLKTGDQNAKPRSAIIQAADDLIRKIASFDGPSRESDELRSGAGQAAAGLLSHG